MTMRITIKNEDTHRTAKVAQVDGPRSDPAKQAVALTEIGPGESADFWIHSNRHLEIDEKQEG